jgi:hypothetical protein
MFSTFLKMFFSQIYIMQLFSADATIFSKKNLKEMLHPKTFKNCPQKLLIIGPNFFFQYCQLAQNQPKSHFLFHKNVSLDFYIMTLVQSTWGIQLYAVPQQALQSLAYSVI